MFVSELCRSNPLSDVRSFGLTAVSTLAEDKLLGVF